MQIYSEGRRLYYSPVKVQIIELVFQEILTLLRTGSLRQALEEGRTLFKMEGNEYDLEYGTAEAQHETFARDLPFHEEK